MISITASVHEFFFHRRSLVGLCYSAYGCLFLTTAQFSLSPSVSTCILHFFFSNCIFYCRRRCRLPFLVHSALLTLASFRFCTTDWRPFKRATETIVSYTLPSSASQCAVSALTILFDQGRHAEGKMGFGTSLGAHVMLLSFTLRAWNINFFVLDPSLFYLFFLCDFASRHSGRR